MNQDVVTRVSEYEVADLNPVKQFMPDAPICLDRGLYKTPLTFEQAAQIGEKGARLCAIVADIKGVSCVKISKGELRVFKYDAYNWDELSKPVRQAFRDVFGKDVVFVKENPVIVALRRLRVQLKSTQS
jgi:hypothetical protein